MRQSFTIILLFSLLLTELCAQPVHGMLTDRTRFVSAGTPVTITIKINDNNDDGEEDVPGGNTSYSSSDLEKTYDGGEQIIGLRFNNVTVPQGSTITEAYIQFTSRHSDSNACTLSVNMEFADNSAPFSGDGDFSGRTWTTATVQWIPPAWTSSDQKDDDTKTSDIASAVQEVVNRGNWQSGNSMSAFVSADPFDGQVNQRRNSRSHNNSSGTKAAELIITYLQ